MNDMKCYFCKGVGATTTVDYCTATGRKYLPSFGPNFDKRYGFPAHRHCLEKRLANIQKKEKKR